ncbi:MAG TPA: hypothetical protein PLP30_09040 [Clostridia bacterium]|nr:hypothetical protein [Clostridia bacterium]HRX42141.1 hypothetical protein [Clostridia bacterium]
MMNNGKINPWDARFGFFWYNDDEIFRFNEKEFDDKARRMAESGINIVMTFSCTHFRWSMKENWDVITKCLRDLTDACHRHGILVVEHHSSHLTFDPLDDEEWDYMERVLNKRNSSIDSWEGLRDYVSLDTIKGTESFRQIDGRTGEPARSNYKGWCMCFNNPDYRKEYFSYLERLYKETGIDGIMTDDVQYFGFGHACTCKHCRKLFRERHGYELPAPGEEWESFYDDFENPVFIAWQKFKKESTLEFQERVDEHFKGLGMEMLRPNYVSGNITFNWTAYSFEKALHLWDWVFQENCFSFVIKYSWPQFLTESRHRFNMGRLKGIPSMSMFYPDRYDSFYFTWALSMAWGQLFTATPEGEDMCDIEKIFRDFEMEHSSLLFNQQKKADVTIYWSYETANFTDPNKCRHISAVKGWTQALTFAGYSTDMVFASEESIDNDVHSFLIVPDVWILSEDEVNKLNRFIECGGKVLFTGKPAGVTGTPLGQLAEKAIFLAGTELDNKYYEPFNVDRWKRTSDRKKLPEFFADEMAESADAIIGDHVSRTVLPEKHDAMLNTYFSYDAKGENMLVHIINAMGTLDSTSEDGGHADTVPAFTKSCPKLTAFDLRVRESGIKKAYMFSIEFEGEKELRTTRDGEYLVIRIPGNTFSGHAIIRIPTGHKEEQ